MKYLGAILAALLLFTGCKDDPVSNEFEPYRVGSWLVTSETKADWVGQKGRSDTLSITQPGQQQMKIWKDTTQTSDNKFNLQFIDSTLTREHEVGKISYYFDGNNVSGSGYLRESTYEYTKITMDLDYIGESPNRTNNLYIDVHNKDSVAKTYKVLISGFDDAIQEIL